MANTVIALKKSGTPSSVPGSLEYGELAVNYADGKIYYKAANGTVVALSTGGGTGTSSNSFSTINAAGTLLVAETPTNILNLVAGNNITITGDAITDTITIASTASGGDPSAAFDRANSAQTIAIAAFDKANSPLASVNVSETGPTSPSAGNLWWNSNTGKLLIYFTDADATSQWVEAYGSGGGTETGQIASAFNQANAAYNQANTAYGVAFDQANTAYNQANSAFNEANTAESIAVAAYNAANNASGVTVGKAIAIALVFGG